MKGSKRNRTPAEAFLGTVRDTIRRFCLIQPGETVIIAVSGGADSVALLRSLHAIKDELRLSLRVAHLNHCIRGASADRDALFVEDLALKLNIPFHFQKKDVPAIQRKCRIGLEEAAREVRYEFLRQLAEETGASKIAVGHTAEDRVETFMLNLMRGTGSKGLTAVGPIQGEIIRPLIGVWRSEVEEYLQILGQNYCTDETNFSEEYSRNRIRLVTLPFLEKEYPGVSKRIWSLCEIISGENDLLAEKVESELEQAVDSRSEDRIVLSIPKLLRLRIGSQRLVLRNVIETIKGDLRDIGFEQIERILQRISGTEDFGLPLPTGRVLVLKRGNELVITRFERPGDKRPFCIELPIPGFVYISGLGRLSAEYWNLSDYLRPRRSNDVVVDSDKISGALLVRNWQEGDRITPLGMRGERKLQDIFTDLKIPVRERHRTPIVADSEKIIWVSGIEMSDLVKITKHTRRALRIEWLPQ